MDAAEIIKVNGSDFFVLVSKAVKQTVGRLVLLHSEVERFPVDRAIPIGELFCSLADQISYFPSAFEWQREALEEFRAVNRVKHGCATKIAATSPVSQVVMDADGVCEIPLVGMFDLVHAD
jgi:hypothetical protein